MKLVLAILGLLALAHAHTCYKSCKTSSDCPAYALSCQDGCCHSGESTVQEMESFRAWTNIYSKKYASDGEFQERFDVYKSNLKIIDYMNKVDTAHYGTTKFADLTPEEFKATYLSPRDFAGERKKPRVSVAVRNDLPTSWDWRDKGAVTAVKDQGQCGSCWAFSAVCNIEGIWFLAGNPLTAFSEQQLVDCSRDCDPKQPQLCNGGCNGGEMYLALENIIKNNITTEEKYPYRARDEKCTYDPSTAVGHISDWEPVAKDEKVIAQYLVDHGPLSIGVNAEWMQFYFGGISDPLWCSPKKLDHGVAIVGYGNDKKDFWIIKNSWGSGWGEHGYFRLVRGKNKCGVAEQVASAKA